MTDERWQITRSKIVMRADEEPRVVAAGSAIAMEALWLEMIEREDDFYLTLEPVPDDNEALNALDERSDERARNTNEER